MKTVSIIVRSALAVCFAFVMSSASCDLFDKVDDVNIVVVLDHTFNVDESAEGTNVTYELKQVLDAADVDSEFDKYKTKIKTVTITDVTYKITNCENQVIFSDGVVGFSAVTANAASKVAELGVQDLKAAENQVNHLTYTQAAVDELANLIKNDQKVNLYLTGTLSNTPAAFDVTVTVNANITADALK